jgi:N-methylhydantoinase A/oxoprolinase/acetone carboxylase beta subunit
VGSAPGPACFALGGTEATITDACLVMGLLDTASFFGGDLALDLARARDAIESRIGGPLGLSIEAAALAMEQAWVDSVARHLREFTGITSETVLAAFGGAGPLVVCRIAQAAGISRVLIPGLAAVFSAFGLGYSDIAHEYAAPLASATAADLDACLADLHERAQAGMYAEGFELADCELASTLHARNAAGERAVTLRDRALPADLPAGARLSVSLTVARRLPQPVLRGQFGTARVAATPCGVRRIQGAAGSAELPVFRAEEQACGAEAIGPAVLEEAYFTCRVDAGWRFEINDNGDILLSRT